MDAQSSANAAKSWQLRFLPYRSGAPLMFPCDELGIVALDELSERTKVNYLFARGMVGRSLLAPQVVPAPLVRN